MELVEKCQMRMKERVFKTMVRPTMLYDLEAVAMKKRQEVELEVAELKMLRFSLEVMRMVRIKNESIRGTDVVKCFGDKVRVFNLFLLLSAQGQNRFHVQEADRASLHINPNRLQFFEYESISFSCVGSQGPTEWRVMKKLPSNSPQWKTSSGLMDIKPTLVSHSGEYFCENEEGERSNTVNITVIAGDVILESPALPVTEGKTLTLTCRKQGTSFKLPADFSKNGDLIKTEYTGEMTIHNISMSDEGFYKCSISGSQAESPESWLPVTVSCFSYEPPTPESGPTYEQVGVAVPQTAVYATKQKTKTGCGEENVDDPNNVMYATVTTKGKTRDLTIGITKLLDSLRYNLVMSQRCE
ncbi:low affinity immunoglobulin gamma Fc region receptor II-a-like [Anabas testudineus]|uniref:low affinity immunoglobulin gamma Fc region receptor II-a-like n=1 Tax=Anabas testudineus TaxID=64144 RepID=UPI00143D6396|nr:low affinity immunoglobulin gamma Fc region receptor II-a-like [Anabas testudineus]